MKSRWWIAAFLLLALALLVQPGCDTAAELPMEATPEMEDPAAGLPTPGEEGMETPAETPKQDPAATEGK